MGLGLLNVAMLVGLAGVSIPILIHLLSRRNDPIVDWGAMQFLEFSPRERRRLNLAELLLMLARMALLALVALALARPFWMPKPAGASSDESTLGESASRRDVVIVLDGSSRMGRKSGGSTPADRSIAWARSFVKRLKPGDSVAVLVAKDRVRGLVDPPSFDLDRVDRALAEAPSPRGSSDLPSAIGEALRVLEKSQNPARDVVVLSDGRRSAWRPGDVARWSLLRDLRGRMPTPPRIWAPGFAQVEAVDGPPDGSVGPLELSRAVLTPGLPVDVTAVVSNAGPGPMTRPVELVVDDRVVPGSTRSVGPIPAGGKTPVSFRTEFDKPGSHLVGVRLAPAADPLPVDDESARPVSVASALAVLLVDGEPGLEPLSGEVDFLRAALAPTGDPSPLVKASTVTALEFKPEMLKGKRVVVLANVDRLGTERLAAIGAFVESGGGLLIAPGDRTNVDVLNEKVAAVGVRGWLPARIGALKGDLAKKSVIAHPSPRTFDGPALGPLGKGDAPALGEADLFAYRVLEPALGASVSARLDTGDPWLVEKGSGKGRVALLASAIDAEGGTLPVNPDFVPWAHELIAHLAAGAEAPRSIKAGEPLEFAVEPPPPPDVKTLSLTTPSGLKVTLPVSRSGTSARVRQLDTSEPGIYRLELPSPGGGFAYAAVAGDDREPDPSSMEPAEAEVLARGWPLAFEPNPDRLPDRILRSDRVRRSEVWRVLILAALGILCLEVWLTRQMARKSG